MANPINIHIVNSIPLINAYTICYYGVSADDNYCVLLIIRKEKTAVITGVINKNHILGSLLNCLNLLMYTAPICMKNDGYDSAMNIF
jgi:hypothetical protein